MVNMKKACNIFIISIILIFTSCEKEIKFKGEIVEPLIVVNSVINPDSIITAQLSRSKFFLSNDEGFAYVKNADISVYINGNFKDKLTYSINEKYVSTVKPSEYDTVLLIISVPEFEEVQTSTILPSQINLISCDTSYHASDVLYDINYGIFDPEEHEGVELGDTIGIACYGEIKFNIKFKDPIKDENFYRLTISKKETYNYDDKTYTSEVLIPFDIEDFNPEVGDSFFGIDSDGNNNKEYIVSDELFNGKEHNLRVSFDYYKYEVSPKYEDLMIEYTKHRSDAEFTLYLQSLNKDLFYYIKTARMALNGSLIEGFSEPVQVYTNIENGLGIFGANTNLKIQLKP